MAAPTDVRVYAVAAGIVTVRWVTDGSAGTDIYRSPDGVTYANVGSVAIDVDTFDDTGLSNKTKYWYKLTDDAAMSFSSVVTVVTHTVLSKRGGGATFTANQAKGDAPTSLDYNEMVYQLEDEINVKHKQQDPCGLCIVDGAIVIDCMSGCDWFRVVLDQDINSISLIGCDDCPQVDFIIPPEETYGICGWPNGCDFGGDECHDAPLEGGPLGRIAKTNGVSYGDYGQASGPVITGGGGGGGTSCPCPASTELSIHCCNGCTLDCETVKSASFRACGGLGPYHWSLTNGDSLLLSSTSGTKITVSVNPLVSVPGLFPGTNAFIHPGIKTTFWTSSLVNCFEGGQAGNGTVFEAYQGIDCDGNDVGSPVAAWISTIPTFPTFHETANECNGDDIDHNITHGVSSFARPDSFVFTMHFSGLNNIKNPPEPLTFTTSAITPGFLSPTASEYHIDTGISIDVRTDEMIEANCGSTEDPCDLTDAMLTVTDSVGASVTIAIS